jgi:hypothetical protein
VAAKATTAKIDKRDFRIGFLYLIVPPKVVVKVRFIFRIVSRPKASLHSSDKDPKTGWTSHQKWKPSRVPDDVTKTLNICFLRAVGLYAEYPVEKSNFH